MNVVSEHPHTIRSTDGREYHVSILGEERPDGTWAGYIEFRDVKSGKKLRTDQETSQPNRQMVEYWATGLEDLYFDGALERAQRSS